MRRLLLAHAILIASCSSCEEPHTVPFALDAGHASEPQRDPEPGQPEPSARPALEARSFPDGTRQVAIEGAPLSLDGSIRSLLAHDFDGDGDRDALVIASTPAEPAKLLYFVRDGATFGPPRALGAVQGTCTISQSTLRELPPARLVAEASLLCGEDSRREAWILSLDARPRSLEHLGVLDARTRAPGAVDLVFSTFDRDSDEHADLVVGVTVREEGREPATIELPWLDRPSGLARQASEPEATFTARAREATRNVRRQAERALASARGVLALHAVLCRESNLARVRVGETEGLSCGSSQGAATAALVQVQALARLGRLAEALDALEVLDRPGLAMDDERRGQAREAIARAPATPGVTLREGPEIQRVRWGTAARLSALAFLDEDHVLLRADLPHVWDLTSGAVAGSIDPQSDLRIRDPSGELAVGSLGRRCEGTVLRIVGASSIVSGVVVGPARATPLVEPRDPPAGAPCPDLTPALRDDAGGWRALGWAPQGVLVAQKATLRIVPLDLSGQPAGPPTVIADGTPPPAPLPAGAITSDGRYFVELRAGGVLVHRTGPSASSALLWPEGWAGREGVASDPAVSPSGRRVAVVRGGRVLLLERATAP